ncbi:MAG: DUF4326 domain-containing protein [Desulfovibrio sp.]|uniref:DUF4326 domain-containing protein n=1 Tax=Desulfovibrio sp. TaxID=885 RepID=UPI00135D32C6|nr:DUF4326 domain-containing protein [Desulfovibrio sp.]MTJ94210.1 DUF4326 domain-containing protein [Desulfovibrio sp.]
MPVFNHLTERDFIPPGAIRIMRPSKWGNPFVIGRDGDRNTVLARYREWLWAEINAGRVRLPDLAGLDGAALVCCCAPKPCHGEILLAAAAWAARKLAV